jgi:peptide/nickel transport system ATP-binding protein
MKDNILDIHDLNIRFSTFEGLFTAVNNVSFSLGYDQSIGIIGESGCGKSTLGYSIMKYLPSNAVVDGEIDFKGDSLLLKSEKEMSSVRGNRIAMVFQNPYSSLNPAHTIGFQLDEVSIHHQHFSKAEARKASIEALEMMNLGDPKSIVKRYPHQISGGIQQRICIAMAILCKPDLMILDEPTTALDVTTEAVILDSISTLREKLHMSLIYISHDIGVINKVAEQIMVMYSGEIVEKGPKEEIFNNPTHPYTRALINCMPRGGVVKENTKLNSIKGYVKKRGSSEKGCPFADRCDKRNSTCEQLYKMREVGKDHIATCDRAYATDIPDIIIPPKKKIKSKDIEPTFEEKEILSLKDITKTYGTRKKVYAVNGIDISVQSGTVLGIVGESGCGKSTTGHMVSGLYKPTSGSITFNEKDIAVSWRHRNKDILKNIQLIFQNPGRSLNPSHTVQQIIDRPMKKLGFITNTKERQQIIIEMLNKVDLGKEYLTKKPRQLSGGEQQRVAIARALTINPQLVVCDEPTSALDVSVQASVLNLLNDLQIESNVAYMFISHDLNVINYLSDYIMVMYAGKIAEYGTRDEVMAPPFHPYTEALLSAVPEVDPTKKKIAIELEGNLPNPSKKIVGCPFAGRCHKQVGSICETQAPPLVQVSPSHYYYCHISPKVE